jgi:hypothetical protein
MRESLSAPPLLATVSTARLPSVHVASMHHTRPILLHLQCILHRTPICVTLRDAAAVGRRAWAGRARGVPQASRWARAHRLACCAVLCSMQARALHGGWLSRRPTHALRSAQLRPSRLLLVDGLFRGLVWFCSAAPGGHSRPPQLLTSAPRRSPRAAVGFVYVITSLNILSRTVPQGQTPGMHPTCGRLVLRAGVTHNSAMTVTSITRSVYSR